MPLKKEEKVELMTGKSKQKINQPQSEDLKMESLEFEDTNYQNPSEARKYSSPDFSKRIWNQNGKERS